MASKSQINLIRSLAIKRGLDPAAVLAVARQEGLGGGVGDNGTSFGPWQLHVGGAFPTGIRGNRQSWAWSPAGLRFALNRMASVAGGLHGSQAVRALVRKFERPADPESEIAGALQSLGQAPSAGIPGGYPLASSTAVPAPLNDNPLLRAILSGAKDLTPVIRTLAARHALGGSVSPSMAPQASGSILDRVAPAELLQEGLGGPTHSTGPHIHAAYTNPQAVLAAIRLAQELGLNIRENPYVDTVDPVHAKNSYHYRTFPGLFGGKHLGQAIDVSGANAAKFYALLSRGRV